MTLKRTTMMILGGAAFAGWLSAAISPSRSPAPVDPIAPSPVDARATALASEIARLHERLRPDPSRREPTRNPFAFQAARSDASVSPVPGPAARAGGSAAVDVPGSRLTLAGIAEDPSPQGGSPVRTAIIAGNGQAFLVKEGDTVTEDDVKQGVHVEYRVKNISADSAELVDLRDSSIRRLVLK